MGFKECSGTAGNDVFGMQVKSAKLFGCWRRDRGDFQFLRAVVAAVTDTRPSFTLLLVFAATELKRVDAGGIGWRDGSDFIHSRTIDTSRLWRDRGDDAGALASTCRATEDSHVGV